MNSRSQGFTPRDKVRHSADFARIKAKGRTLRGQHFILRFLENGLAAPRLGLIVSKKHGRAVTRNRLKRRLREIFRINRGRFPGGMDLLVIPIGRAAALSFDRLREEFLSLVARLPQRTG